MFFSDGKQAGKIRTGGKQGMAKPLEITVES